MMEKSEKNDRSLYSQALLFGSSELYVKSAREKGKNYHFQFIKFFPTVLIKNLWNWEYFDQSSVHWHESGHGISAAFPVFILPIV